MCPSRCRAAVRTAAGYLSGLLETSVDPLIRSVSVVNPYLLRNQLVDQIQNAETRAKSSGIQILYYFRAF